MSDGISADTGIGGGMTRARADNELCRVLLDQLLNGNLIISENVNRGPLQDEVLIDIPSE